MDNDKIRRNMDKLTNIILGNNSLVNAIAWENIKLTRGSERDSMMITPLGI
jgi:hypothetical protein